MQRAPGRSPPGVVRLGRPPVLVVPPASAVEASAVDAAEDSAAVTAAVTAVAGNNSFGA